MGANAFVGHDWKVWGGIVVLHSARPRPRFTICAPSSSPICFLFSMNLKTVLREEPKRMQTLRAVLQIAIPQAAAGSRGGVITVTFAGGTARCLGHIDATNFDGESYGHGDVILLLALFSLWCLSLNS